MLAAVQPSWLQPLSAATCRSRILRAVHSYPPTPAPLTSWYLKRNPGSWKVYFSGLQSISFILSVMWKFARLFCCVCENWLQCCRWLAEGNHGRKTQPTRTSTTCSSCSSSGTARWARPPSSSGTLTIPSPRPSSALLVSTSKWRLYSDRTRGSSCKFGWVSIWCHANGIGKSKTMQRSKFDSFWADEIIPFLKDILVVSRLIW